MVLRTLEQSIASLTRQKTEPPGVMRPRKVNAAPDNRSFQPPRANMSIDNLKPKHIPDSKIWSQDTKISNIESKPMPIKKLIQKTKLVQKTKLLNKETIDQPQKTVAKTEIKRIPQKYSGGLNNLAAQKRNLLTAATTKVAAQLSEEITAAPKIYKVANVANIQVQKTKPQDTPVTPKPKLDNDISTLKNKVQDNDSHTTTVNTKIKSTPVQNHEAIQKPKDPASEVAPKTNLTQEKKTQDNKKDDKETTAQSVEKQITEQTKCEEPSKEILALDPVLERAIEEELQDIMIQVWQQLPDDPSEEQDRIAVDKLRNEVGDDLRRVLGLNITKRLLNVYNNLFVKMQFTCRPQMGCLTNFLNEYHINKFKRINMNSNTFASQMNNIEDFDKLCAAKEIMCGEAKVIITPCYKFTVCPENLKTIYNDTYFYEDGVQENTESPKSKNVSKTTKAITVNKNIKPVTKTQNIDAKSTDKMEITKTANSVLNDSKCIKNDLESKVVNSVNDKTDEIETQKSTDLVCIDSKIDKSDSIAVEEVERKANDSSKTELVEKKVVENIQNEKQIHKDVAKDRDISDYIIKDKLESDDDGDFELGIPECQMEGDEELDDEDILALMSEGVVLDECSGSEDEN